MTVYIVAPTLHILFCTFVETTLPESSWICVFKVQLWGFIRGHLVFCNTAWPPCTIYKSVNTKYTHEMHQIMSHVFDRDFAPGICRRFPHETNFLPISPILQYNRFSKEIDVHYPLQLYIVCSSFFCRLIVLLLFSSTWPDFAKNAREYILLSQYFVHGCVPHNPDPIHSKESPKGTASFSSIPKKNWLRSKHDNGKMINGSQMSLVFGKILHLGFVGHFAHSFVPISPILQYYRFTKEIAAYYPFTLAYSAQ